MKSNATLIPAVRQLGTLLSIPAGARVIASPATNQPDKTQFFVALSKWPGASILVAAADVMLDPAKPQAKPHRRKIPLALRLEYRLGNDGDAWGRVMGWKFALADYLTSRGLPVPAAWVFRQSPMGPDRTSWEYQTLAKRKDTPRTLARFGAALHRLDSMCRAAGRDY